MPAVTYARDTRRLSLQRPQFDHRLAARRLINFAWEWLTPEQQTLLQLRYWSGLTPGQVADQSGVPIAEVQQVEAAALLLCRKLLGPLMEVHP